MSQVNPQGSLGGASCAETQLISTARTQGIQSALMSANRSTSASLTPFRHLRLRGYPTSLILRKVEGISQML